MVIKRSLGPIYYKVWQSELRQNDLWVDGLLGSPLISELLPLQFQVSPLPNSKASTALNCTHHSNNSKSEWSIGESIPLYYVTVINRMTVVRFLLRSKFIANIVPW